MSSHRTAGASIHVLQIPGQGSAKLCKKCRHPKQLSAFQTDKKCLDGRRNVCRECNNTLRNGKPETAEWRRKYNGTPAGRFRKAKWIARERGFEFTLSFDQYVALVSLPCHYCRDRLGDRTKLGVGLDRLNNSVGYVVGNVVSCCGTCNRMKSDWMTPEEAHAAVEAILQLRARRQ